MLDEIAAHRSVDKVCNIKGFNGLYGYLTVIYTVAYQH